MPSRSAELIFEARWLLTEISPGDRRSENPTATIIPVALPAARYPNTFNSRPISHFP
jgi:hypothetical protein